MTQWSHPATSVLPYIVNTTSATNRFVTSSLVFAKESLFNVSHQVTNELDLEVQGEITPALIEQGTVESPTVVMSVTARWVTLI